MKPDKRVINAWAFYDWANSVYPLIITTAIFPIYYSKVTPEKVFVFGKSFYSSEIYSYAISLSFLIVAFLSPLLSGIADYYSRKKFFLKTFCYLGASTTALLFFYNGQNIIFGMLMIILASIGFWSSLVFYNAFLPAIAPPSMHDKVSAKGYALGYIGSSILLIALLTGIMAFEMPAKWAFPITAVWWAGFAQYTYKNLPEPENDMMSKDTHILLKGFKELAHAYQGVKELPYLKIFLLAFFIYSMGVQTVMQMATLFGIQEINNMPESGLIISVLIIQFIAVAGSYGFSFLSGKMGNVKALAVSLIIWIVICIIAYFIYNPWEFYALAALVGLVMGGIQSLSRSTYSKMLPPTKDLASYFSFYDITEKIGVVVGTFSFGWIVGITGSMRNSVFALLLYFLIGLIIITRVKYNWKK